MNANKEKAQLSTTKFYVTLKLDKIVSGLNCLIRLSQT